MKSKTIHTRCVDRRWPMRFVRGMAAAFAICLLAAPVAHAAAKAIDKPGENGSLPIQAPEATDGWRRVPFESVDELGRPMSSEIYEIVGAKGVAYAPVPELIRDQLIEQMAAADDSETVSFALTAPIVDEIALSLKQGAPTAMLLKYASQDPGSFDDGQTIVASDGRFSPMNSCSDTFVTRNRSLSYTPSISGSQTFGGGFSGTVSASGGGNLSATGEVQIRVLRTRIFWTCVPYGVRFQHARVFGNLNLNSTLNLNGTLNYANPNPIEFTIAKPFLGGFAFAVGPVPVYIGFNLPITAGAEISATVTGQVQFNAGFSASGSFNYICTSSSCSGTQNFTTSFQNPSNPFGASINGRIQPSPFAEVAVRAFLFHDAFAYAQVGLRGYLRGDLWAYSGNMCGDADGNGINETVSALTFNLDWQLALKAKVAALGNPWSTTLWTSNRWHIRFWDLIGSGSTALRPMIGGPSTTGVNMLTTYTARMRPCYIYSDTINYVIGWGDSTTSSFSGAPASPVARTKQWGTTGIKTLTLRPVSDSHGRVFNANLTNSRSILVN
jgi:hypothetical protein